jgi:hypothetical protein
MPIMIGSFTKTGASIPPASTCTFRTSLNHGVRVVQPSSLTFAYRILPTLDTGCFRYTGFRCRLVIHPESYRLFGSNRTYFLCSFRQARVMVDSGISSYTMWDITVPLDTRLGSTVDEMDSAGAFT